MTKIEVTILDPVHDRIAQTIRQDLPSDWQATFAPSRDKDDQISAIAAAEVVFLIGMPAAKPLLDAAPHLKMIQKLGIGVDKIDCETCRARGIAVARVTGGNAIPVAEHTVMMMLATLRRLPLIDRKTRAGAWQKEEARGLHRQISGRQVGLIGFGAIGRAVARLLTGFNARVVYYDPTPCDPAIERDLMVHAMALDDLIASSDIISLHLPLLPATAGLIDQRRIALMKPDAILVNCARGGLVDEAALHQALRDHRILGAGLDVFATEPPAGSPLLEQENTVITSHMAGATLDNFRNVFERGIDNVRGYLASGRLPTEDAVVWPDRQG